MDQPSLLARKPLPTSGGSGPQKRTRRYFVAANWKSNGTTHFVKDIISNLINSFEYDPKKLDLMILPGLLHISLVQAMVPEHVTVGA